MLNVLHIISDTNIGGAGRHLLTFLEKYDRSRIRVWVLCPPGSLLLEGCKAAGVETYTSPYFAGDKSFGWRGLTGLLREVGGIIKKHGIDVVHTHATFTGRLAAVLAGTPCVVYTRHRMDWESPRRGVKKMAIALLNRMTCHRVIAVSG
ncbi:MAG: glycosyltransferase, partial [Peptococcaceae bacterium]|nr:glycosyltransferase [Peptococcaceae bacterium]